MNPETTIAVRFTDDELATIEAAAKRAGMSLNDWLVRMTLDDEFRAAQHALAKDELIAWQ